MPMSTASLVDSLSVDPHCALRCLPLGACVDASESRRRRGIAAAALSTADRPARSRDRYDLLVASNPEALDDQSRQPGTRCARVCSPSTVEGPAR